MAQNGDTGQRELSCCEKLKKIIVVGLECAWIFLGFAIAAAGPTPMEYPPKLASLYLLVAAFLFVLVFGLPCLSHSGKDSKLKAWAEGLVIAIALVLLNYGGVWLGASAWSWYVVIAVALIVLDILAMMFVGKIETEPDTESLKKLKVGKAPRALERNNKWMQILMAPEEMPGLLLTAPALSVLAAPAVFGCFGAVPDTQGLRWVAFGVFLGIAVIVGSMHFDRRKLVWTRQFLRRILSEGFAKYVSIVVVLLAILRLVEQKHVSILIEETAASVLLQLIFSAYFLAWLVDGIRRRSLGRYVSCKLGDDVEVKGLASGDLEVDYSPVGGGSRKKELMLQWQLLQRLVEEAGCDEKKIAEEVCEKEKDAKLELKNSVNSRRVAGDWALIIVLLFVVGIGWYFGWPEGPPVVAVDRSGEASPDSREAVPGLVSLRDRLESTAQPNPILIAASGGGTRASLFTHAALRGLSETNNLDRIVVLSGVSGGSIAIAAFLNRTKELTCENSEKCSDAWEAHLEDVAYPYIDDVLVGATVFRWPPWSLSHHLVAAMNRRVGEMHIGDVDDLGVIFNTTISGYPRLQGGEGRGTDPENCSGGRLVFTNLKELTAEWPPECASNKASIPYVTIQDAQIPLAEAASLSANFPPVFHDAALEVTNPGSQKHRVYVTDGGVLENWGVHAVLRALSASGAADGGQECKSAETKTVTLLVLEASGIPGSYEPGRGLTAISESHTRLAAALNESLRCQYPNIRYRELTMPDILRRDFTTHLKVPERLALNCGESEPEEVTRSQLKVAISNLYVPNKDPDAEKAYLESDLAACLKVEEQRCKLNCAICLPTDPDCPPGCAGQEWATVCQGE